jgi:hypothetical protein
MLGGSIPRSSRRIIATHEAKIREMLEDEEDDFTDGSITEGVRALDIRSPPATTTTFESREIAPGEFYGSSSSASASASGSAAAASASTSSQQMKENVAPLSAEEEAERLG